MNSMKNIKSQHKIKAILFPVIMFLWIIILASCNNDHRLDKVVIHENPFVTVTSKPVVLADHLDNPAAPVFIGNRLIFSESGKGTIYEYKDNEKVALIKGFGLDSYAGYSISVLGLTPVPGKNTWIVAASQDDGHILLFDESTFPTTAAKGREIPFERTEPSNPFAVLLAHKGSILVATGGTKSVYQSIFNLVDPAPLKPVFDVPTGMEGMAEDPKTGDVYGAIVGSGKNDGSLVRWNPASDSIQLHTLAAGFSNLVGVLMMPNGLLLVLEFGAFGVPESGRVSVIDPNNPDKIYPLISGLDFPSGFSLSADNTLLISTFGKKQSTPDGMAITLQIAPKK